jgi:hypothetical protein
MSEHRLTLDRRTVLKTGLAIAGGAGLVSNAVGTGNAEITDDRCTLSMIAPAGTPYETAEYAIFLDSWIGETPSLESNDAVFPLFVDGFGVTGSVTEGDYDAVQYNRDGRIQFISVDGYVEIGMQDGLPDPVSPDQTVRLTIEGQGDKEARYYIDMTGPTTDGTDLEDGENLEGAISGYVSNGDTDRYTATGQFYRVQINGSATISAEYQ